MKKVYKLIIALTLVVSCFCLGTNLLQKNSVFAENFSNPTEYYEVERATWNNTLGKYVSKHETQKFNELDAFLISSDEGIIVTLGRDTDEISYTTNLERLSYRIVINDNLTFDNQAGGSALNNYGVLIKEQTEETLEDETIKKRLEISIGPKIIPDDSINEFIYGKYTIELSFYYIDENLESKHVQFSSSMYILNNSNYVGATALSYSSLQGSGSIYNTHYQAQELPRASYNYKSYNLSIVRLNKGLSTTTNFVYTNNKIEISSYDEFGVATPNNNVSVYIDESNGQCIVTFRNLGIYYLTYTPINPNGQNEEIKNFYNNEAGITNHTVHVFGYQLNYTSADGLKEFKMTNDENPTIVEDENKKPWIIESSKYTSDITYKIISGIEDALVIQAKDIAKTNQAPVYFDTNAVINVNEGGKYNSKYYYFANDEEYDKATSLPNNIWDGISEVDKYVSEDYSGSPLSSTGIYLVEMNYSYSGFAEEGTKQYFLFKITNDAPSVDIYTLNSESGKKNINNDQFAFENVFITKSALDVFDSTSKLTVYKDSNFDGVYESSVEVLENTSAKAFEDTAKYKVELIYGNTNKKGFTTYFTIDKNPISEIEIRSLQETDGADYIVGDVVSGDLTSSAIALSWKEKISGAKITAEYKYFPTTYSLTQETSLTSDLLKTIYNSNQAKFSIPSTHIFNYEGGEVPIDEYFNTYGKTTIIQSQALNGGGLYIFKLYDTTGSEPIYKYVFVDKTPNTVIFSDGDNYNISKHDEVTTKDTTIYFGQTKLINVINSNASIDTWLSKYLTNDNYIAIQGKNYFKIGINPKIYYSVDSDKHFSTTLKEIDKYGFMVKAENNGIVNDSQYVFYSISDSTDNYSIYTKDSFEYYKANYTGSHTVRFTTDNSRMSVFYTTNGVSEELRQLPTGQDSNGNSKTNYFQPTTQSQFNILYLKYCVKPNDDMQVASVKVNYYAFQKDEDAVSYKIDIYNPSATITLYENGELKTGEEVFGEPNTYKYSINVETINDTAERTRAGRYEIVRTYTDDSILNQNDPKERKLIFIVDRNGLISEPEYDNNGDSKYYVGSGIQLQIINRSGTNYYADSTLHYYDIYYASKLSQNRLVPVVTTNFLPVTVYVPAYKYGHIEKVEGSPKFVIENSIVKYLSSSTNQNAYLDQAYYSNYKLSAVVQRYSNDMLTSAIGAPVQLNVNLPSYNFLTTADSGNTIKAFDQEGYYKVTISSQAGDTFSFVFRIAYSSPEFEVLDTDNTPINSITESVSGKNIKHYYTNKETIRISWENSPNKYLAKINKDAIKYTIGNSTYTLKNTQVKESGDNGYFIDINLTNIDGTGLNAYQNGSNIGITLQFNGDSRDYNSQYFSKTVIVEVDIESPTTNINRLINQTGLNFNDLREYKYGKKYNVSKQEGMLRYFAFTIDVSTFIDIINEPNMAGDYSKIYYTWFYRNGKNTKYIAGNTYETDITTTDLSGQTDGQLYGNTPNTFSRIVDDENYINTYIEFVEEDLAGNRTVYTIFLTDIQDMQEDVAFTYTRLNNTAANAGNTTQDVLVKDLDYNLKLYSKRSFNLNNINFNRNESLGNLTWQIIKVGDKIFVKSPYGNGKYKLYSSLLNEDLYELEEVTKLGASSNSQTIKLYMVPVYEKIDLSVYVLNKSLDIYTMSEVYGDEKMEGILIRLPETNSEDSNIIYAQNLLIKEMRSGIPSNSAISNENSKYLKEEIELIPDLNNLEISYVSYRDARYVQVQLKGILSENDYFIYTVTDNFGEEYKFIHIYGQTQITNPITSDGTIVESYNQSGLLVYYSSQNIKYRFDTTIYKDAKVTVGYSQNSIDTKQFLISLNDYNQYSVWDVEKKDEIPEEEYIKFFTYSRISNVLLVEMKRTEYNFGSGVYGGIRTFVIEQIPNSDFDFEIENQTMRFEIFNQLPSTLSIVSKEGGIDVTSILSGATAYAGQVIINYTKETLAHDYEILLMNELGDVSVLTDGTLISEDGTYTIIINYLGYINGCSESFSFTIANSEKFVYSVVINNGDGTYKNISATGSGFTYTQDGSEVSISTHFIVNSENYEIILNGNLYLEEKIKEMPTATDGYTYIHKISNLNVSSGLITEYYSTEIAISVIKPTSNGIIKTLVNYGGNMKEDQEENLLQLKTPSITPYVTTKDEYDAGVKIAWSKFNLIEENLVIVEVYYGSIGGMKFVPEIEDINGLNSFTLKTSGTYYIRFVDLAGNVQLFGQYADNEYFTIKYLSSVIFEVNEETPINYAIYDKEVIVKIPDITLAYYDVNTKPKITVELNGVKLEQLNKIDSYTWKFTQPGLYKVWFTAKISEKTIYEAPILFTILSSQESRLAYSYNGYGDYYIEDILKDGVSVKDILTNVNSGDLYTVKDVAYLKNIMLHANDLKTGKGAWTFIINVNNEFQQKFEFTIWINKAIVPIELSIANGGSTTDEILVNFNTLNLLTATGDCIVKITGFEDLLLTKEKLEKGEIQDIYNITITKSGNYYIEVTTLSGQLLYTSYVQKAEPLNAISIIIIVVSVLVVGTGIVLFVLLRRKMKIK